MKIGCYFPNKPLIYQTPSGDRTISEQLVAAISARGHIWREMSSFRTRWFWLDVRKLFQFLPALVYVLKNFRDFQPDLWLTYHSYYKSPDVFGWWIAKHFGKINFVMFQTMYSTKRKKNAKTKPGYLLNTIAVKKADLIFSNNLCDISDLKRIIPEEKIVYIPPGIYPEHFKFSVKWRKLIRAELGISSKDFVLISVARFRRDVKWLSLEFLLKALYLIKKEVPFKLIMVGSGPLEAEVRHLATKLLDNRVFFTGHVERQYLYRYYSAADLFAFPGIGESLGMVYLEAQSCGIPVVAVDGPGVRQVVENNDTGILVESGDIRNYGNIIADLYSNKDRIKEMGDRAREYVINKRNAHKNLETFVNHLEEIGK